MSGSGVGYDLFISYARGTAKVHAQALRDELVRRNRSVFLDEREILYGRTFPAEIAAGLRGSSMVAVFLDEGYLSRPWCVYELQVVTAPYRAARDEHTGGHNPPAGTRLRRVLPPAHSPGFSD